MRRSEPRGPAPPAVASGDPRAEPQWHTLDAKTTAEALGADPTRGLTAETAAERLASGGPNSLAPPPGPSWPSILARQFASALIIVLIVAAAISASIGERADALTILAIVLLNGVLGFVQEWRAERAMAALKSMLSPTTTVRRDGVWISAPAETLVRGDLVRIDTGDRVPADIRLVDVTDLHLDESALTGESLPVAKTSEGVRLDAPLAERESMAWAGTTVVEGRGAGLVVATGPTSQFGRIARLTQDVEDEPTPLQRQLSRLARQLGLASVGVAALVAIVGLVSGLSLLEVFLTGISLAVAVVPEGLPAVVTITLALGLRTMAGRRALLRRLPAAETLGAATVICTDKTGTLTENEMTVREVWLAAGAVEATGAGYDPSGGFVDDRGADAGSRSDLRVALGTGIAAGHASVVQDGGEWRAVGAPTEAALGVAALKAGLEPDERALEREIPFSSDRKRMTVVRTENGVGVAHVKGAPEILFERCTRILDGDVERELTPADRRTLSDATQRLGSAGRRTLALARRRLPEAWHSLGPEDIETDLTLLAIVGILDPPRPEVPEAVARARSAGVTVIMITGDSPATALAIAGDVGIESDTVLTGNETASLDDDALRARLDGRTVFARATPAEKLRIVELLQERGEVVGMTGDGVNDAPALRQADVGIAMGIRGTDVAREAAEIVITDDNFASIVGAVEEGRRQYDNIRKFTRYLLSSNAGEVVAILGNLLLGGPLILLPVQILWMNLVTDGVTALALGLEPAERGIMDRPPRSPRAHILDRHGAGSIVALGVYMGIATILLYRVYGGGAAGGATVAQTLAFTAIVLFEKMNVFNFRSLEAPLNETGWFTNPRLLIAWAAMIGLQVCAVYVPFLQNALHTVPLRALDWLVIAGLAVPIFVVPETIKRVVWRQRTT
ncbi:MAG: HAD-IC family P-type ATPase [Gemmatimonadota bacterium]|nr:HAD-IC family P-type ATPase [Gemmatimonadota bacterium]